MSKKTRAKNDRVISSSKSGRRLVVGALAAGLALALCCAGIVASWSPSVPGGNSPALLAPAPSPTPLPPVKEYIYAGSKLIATEEPNLPPTVSITSPSNDSVFTAPANIPIDATANDTDGTISKVEFYQGTTLLNTDTSAPFTYTWPSVGPGTYLLKAIATDNNNAVTESSPIAVIANALPTVSITNPSNNAVFTAPANITIEATASDTDGTISKVEFYQGTTLLNTDTSAPFTYTWPSVGPGTYSLKAIATDNNNAVTTSSAVTVVSNGAPTVSITNPVNNAAFTAPASITINATASDADGTISKVEFYQGATLLSTDTTAPFNFPWNNVAAGSYSLTAKATDNNNAVKTSNAIAVSVSSNVAPSVSITSPANNDVFTAPATITINATASDADGTISKVEFYQGTTLLGAKTTAPYTLTWNNVATGTYSLTAKATDNQNVVTTSGAITVISNAAPTVSITSPTNNAVFTAPAAVTINATASEADGTISKVEFYQGATLLGTDTTAPFSFTWSNVGAGTYSLTAKATDNNNAVTASSAVTVISNAAPTVSVTSPANNTVFAAPASITINATASDADGTISKVEFYQGTTLLATDTVAPFSFTWNNVAAGTYSLTAKATDNRNAVTTSSAITVISNTAPTVSITNPSNNFVFTAPANITVDATASDTDGTVSKVEFYQGTTLLHTDTSAPFTYTWPSVGPGTYSLTAKATDNNNAVTTSSAISVISNAAPTVSITSPANHAMFAAQSNITIEASASDADGSISSVEFYQGDTLLGSDTTAPFSFTWNTVASGSYLLRARASDNRGAMTTSAAVAVTTPTFYDDFDDNSLDFAKWSLLSPPSPVVVSEQGQQLRITIPASTASYNGVVSNGSYDLRGGTVQVEQVQAVSQAGWAENIFKVEKDANNYYLISNGAGSMVFRSRVNGVNDQSIIPFDPVTNRYWRVRHEQATNLVRLESSPDGLSWTTRKSATAGFDLTAVRFCLYAGAFGTGNANPGAAIYNDFQYIPDPSLPGTPAPLLSDDFNDNSLDTSKWIPDNLFSGFTNMNVPLNETAQRLEIGPLLQNVNGSSYRGVRSLNSYNFTGAYSYVELVQAPSAATAADAMFTVGKDVNDYYRIYVNAGNLKGQRKVGGIKTSLFSIPYDPVNHCFLRIRHESGSVIFDTAPNIGGAPGAWTQRYSEIWNTSVTLGAIIFEVKGGTSQIEANPPGKVIFDNFRVAVNGS